MLVAFVYSALVLPGKPGKPPKVAPTFYPILWKGMVLIPWGRDAIHVHHWLLYGALYACIPMPSILGGFVLGMTLQGLTYKDRFRWVERNPWRANQNASSPQPSHLFPAPTPQRGHDAGGPQINELLASDEVRGTHRSEQRLWLKQ